MSEVATPVAKIDQSNIAVSPDGDSFFRRLCFITNIRGIKASPPPPTRSLDCQPLSLVAQEKSFNFKMF